MTETTTTNTDGLHNAADVLAKMLDMLDVDAKVDIMDDKGKLALNTQDAGRLIGKKGQTLESLELVLNRILKKNDEAGKHTPWVSIDVDGYCVEAPAHEGDRHGKLPKEEIERLQALANDIAKEVKKLKHARIIGPYSPSERRIIHLALENDPDVETVSDPVADSNRGKKITVQLKEQ